MLFQIIANGAALAVPLVLAHMSSPEGLIGRKRPHL